MISIAIKIKGAYESFSLLLNIRYRNWSFSFEIYLHVSVVRMICLFSILPKVPFLSIIILHPGNVENESHFGKLEDRTDIGEVLPRPQKKGIERDFLGPRWGLREEEGKTWSDLHVQAYAMDEFDKNSQRSLGTPEQ